MSEYYDEISYGSFQVDGNVNGWYQSTMSMNEAVEKAGALEHKKTSLNNIK